MCLRLALQEIPFLKQFAQTIICLKHLSYNNLQTSTVICKIMIKAFCVACSLRRNMLTMGIASCTCNETSTPLYFALLKKTGLAKWPLTRQRTFKHLCLDFLYSLNTLQLNLPEGSEPFPFMQPFLEPLCSFPRWVRRTAYQHSEQSVEARLHWSQRRCLLTGIYWVGSGLRVLREIQHLSGPGKGQNNTAASPLVLMFF